MVYIYVLKLEQEKYYIGKTNNPQFRLDNHFTSNGSEWTKIYKPVMLLELKPNCDDYDEDKITRQYMDKYGVENVRGGSFVSIKLNKSTIDHLQQMSNGTNNKCFTCGGNGHFSKDCVKIPFGLQTKVPYKKIQINNKIEDDIDEYIFDYYDSDDFEEIADKLCQELIEMGKIKTRKEWDEIQVKFLSQHLYFTTTAIQSRRQKKLENLELVKARLAAGNYTD